MRTLLTAIYMIITLTACGEPTVDSSSEEAFGNSLDAMREGLAGSELEEFQEAAEVLLLEYLVGEATPASLLAAELEGEDAYSLTADFSMEPLARMNGMTAEQVVSEAAKVLEERRKTQIQVLREEIDEIEIELGEMLAAKQEYERLQSEKNKIAVSDTKLYWREDRFSDTLVMELTVFNGLDQAISRVFMEGVLATPNRSVPWVEDNFNYEISGGLEPGETQSWSLAPNQFSDWGKAPKNRDDTVFTVSLLDAEDANGIKIFSNDFNQNIFDLLNDELSSKQSMLSELDAQ